MPESPQPAPLPSRPQFGLGFLFLLTLVFSAIGACGYYLAQAWQQKITLTKANFVFFVLVVPLALMILVNIVHAFSSWLKQRSRRPGN